MNSALPVTSMLAALHHDFAAILAIGFTIFVLLTGAAVGAVWLMRGVDKTNGLDADSDHE